MNKKELLNTAKRFACYLLLSITAGFLLLLIAYALPDGPIRANVAASMTMFEGDWIYPQWANGLTATSIDLWADAIVLQEACAEGSGTLIQKALLNPKLNNPGSGLFPPQILRLYTEGALDLTQCVYMYPRYWHGYLIVVRPLLAIMTVGHIRVLNVTAQLLLFMYVCRLIEQKLGLIYIPPFFISWIVINLFSTGLCFEYTFIAYISLFAMVYLLKKKDRILLDPYGRFGIYDLFVFVGIATAYFDFLTFPLIGLGIPLCYWLVIRKPDFRTGFKDIIMASLSWVFAYGLMWSSKWVLATVLTDSNIVQDGISQVLYRTSGPSSASYTAAQVIVKNLGLLGYKAFLIILLAAAVWYVYGFIKHRYWFRMHAGLLLYPVTALMPVVWYTVIKNHSYVHSYMTHRNLAVLFCALLCMVSSCIRPGDDTAIPEKHR